VLAWWRMLRATTLVVAVTLPALSARADVWSPRLGAQVTLGLGTPVGYAGIVGEWSPLPRVSVGAGIGLGGGTESSGCLPSGVVGVCSGPLRDRIQVAVLSRFRVVQRHHMAFFIGGGFSGGGYSWDELTTDEPAHKSADRAYWANFEIGVERRWESGVTFSAFAGYGRMLNPSALHCVDTGINDGHCQEAHASSGEQLPYVGLGTGYMFR